jgi:hypothetical protein
MKRITTIHLEGSMPKPKAESTSEITTEFAPLTAGAVLEHKERKPRRPRMIALIETMQSRIDVITTRIATLTTERQDLLTAIESLSK